MHLSIVQRLACPVAVCVRIPGRRERDDFSSKTTHLGLSSGISRNVSGAGHRLVLRTSKAAFTPQFCMQLASRLPARLGIPASVSVSRLAFSKVSHPPGPAGQSRLVCTSDLLLTQYPRNVLTMTLHRKKMDRSAAEVITQSASWFGLTHAESIAEHPDLDQAANRHQHERTR